MTRTEPGGREAALAGAVIALTRALGLRTVAEGVETVAHVERLRGLGCDVGQGFSFAAPRPGGAAVSGVRPGR